MWISEGGDPGSAWIQYEFDRPQKLHEMLIWNYNGNAILTLYGLQDVTIEYSTLGESLTVNPSLESPDFGPGGTGQWADNVDNWIINSQGSSYLEDGSWEIVAPDGVATLKMWNGAAIWQQIGNVSPNTVCLLAGVMTLLLCRSSFGPAGILPPCQRPMEELAIQSGLH
jgi:hypothetical protein